MADLVLDGVTKAFGSARAVDGVSLHVPAGTFVCLLGPSGCGKTTLLRMIAGLETPTAGAVTVGGRDLTAVPAHARGFGMVFQSLALFPHLTVAENITYPLRIRGVDRAKTAARVAELLDLVRLPGFGDRAVTRLSGGQRQRVAIARALAVDPGLFLLDEPLSALDAKLREQMQVELRQLQRRLGITTIVVTHDQREAMTMADLVVVMSGGRIRQAAPPAEVYRRPADAFVADFIGSSNILDARPAPGGLAVAGGLLPGLALPAGATAAKVSVRPEDLAPVPPGTGHLEGVVRFVRDLGASVETFVEADGVTLVAAGPGTAPHLAIGAPTGLAVTLDRVVVLP
ncbi:ABC transporter ATP-binding protein [Oharaeibacter diazotrophicus]|uniref:Putative spermidine/putrescine transport system ATP-binding protein n=1 Tax=Oharaeibacter diazotrophicus TaxID=1920512 RepID=A0A4R6R7U0_9HYPH|nr:ABC transporter ATP-binding protein [Oharaeibacter diazotrophicus]TDP81825.1 putative spermidine/putrescine transport system ATP-binding protein [Oharaeibacter diazotrophicus]BBE73457.1 spermidine/putrescine import ATP-binding protein PotA [Pleomorphomonas sp. SM30]GLS75247.1 ABC transporter ATP-binding protein [Oharaeibacter diazotrophicus]